MHKLSMNKLLVLILSLGYFSPPLDAFETAAKQAILFNPQTGTVLFEKNADELMAPSSMSKIMTVYLVFDRLKSGDLKLEDEFPVSTLAWRMGGSRMFVNVDSRVKVDDLLNGIVVQSGNDACIVIAEGLAGNEGVFAVEMTRKAKELGATNTTFKNSTGWPDPLHLSTARDLGLIAQRIIEHFPDYYKTYFPKTEFTYNKIRQPNRNPLLYKNLGADGLKTGATDAGGHGLVASAVQDGQRLILVINGLKTNAQRAREAEALMLWGFRNYSTPKIFAAGEEVAQAHVWLGNKPTVALVADKDIYITMKRSELKDLKVEATYKEPIPVSKIGEIVGKVVVALPDRDPIEVPLRAQGNVKKAGFFKRIKAAIYYLIWGYNDQPS